MGNAPNRASLLDAVAASAAADALCPPVDNAEIVAAALSMNMAGGAGGGAQMLSALLDEALDMAELAKRINAQPGIAVRVMRVANSAYYGQSGKVATVIRASQVVGATTLRGIAAAACFDRMSGPAAPATALDMVAFRSHSLAVACAAQALAQLAAPSLADPAFMAGLLHDVGVLMQWRLRPLRLVKFQAGALPEVGGVENMTASQREAHWIGATHARCGKVLLESWHLPAPLVEAVAMHDQTGERLQVGNADARLLAGLLLQADRMAADAGYGFDNDLPPALESGEILPDLGLTPEQLVATSSALPDTVARLCAVFGE